jgi:hypothetical protein
MKIVFVFACLGAIACGPNEMGSDDDDDTVDAPQGTPDGALPIDATPGPDSPPFWDGVIYAHSSTDLYSVNPDTLAVTHIGPFQWPAGSLFEQMTDIAVDRFGGIIGISYGSIYRVDPDTVLCTYLAELPTQFNGLSFVPASEIDPTGEEILLGAGLDGTLVQIDPLTGDPTTIGSYGAGLGSSGDIVSVDGFGTVATVKMGTFGPDYLARVDLAAGGAATIIGNTGFTDIWGLGFWKGQVYGFLESNEFVLIDPDTGAATFVSNGPQNWWGAGVTTIAPIIP